MSVSEILISSVFLTFQRTTSLWWIESGSGIGFWSGVECFSYHPFDLVNASDDDELLMSLVLCRGKVGDHAQVKNRAQQKKNA